MFSVTEAAVTGALPPATQVTINNGAGDQTHPHVSGDLVSYTSIEEGRFSQIRYVRPTPATLRLTRTGGDSPGPIDESVYSSQPGSGSDFRIADCQYQYNLKSTALGPGSYLAESLINGAAVGDARVELK